MFIKITKIIINLEDTKASFPLSFYPLKITLKRNEGKMYGQTDLEKLIYRREMEYQFGKNSTTKFLTKYRCRKYKIDDSYYKEEILDIVYGGQSTYGKS